MTRIKPSPLASALVDAGRHLPAPSRAAYERTRTSALLALGAATVATAGTSAVSAAASATAPPLGQAGASSIAAGAGAATTLAKGALPVAPLAIVKLLGAGAVVGTLTVGAVEVGRHWLEPGPVLPETQRLGPATSARRMPPVPVGRAMPAIPAPAPEVLPTAVPRDPAPPPTRQLMLAAEIESLDSARAAFGRGEREVARRRLAEYRARFPNGQLMPEAALLTQALSGDQRETERPSPE
ncbi:MAG: hypothetical protein JW751_02975 [Polyangiaceae bacterium]|nr:hypothetical protein [Polyangiaceae bacterium]